MSGLSLVALARSSAENQRAKCVSSHPAVVLKAKDKLVFALGPGEHADPDLASAMLIAVEAIMVCQEVGDAEEIGEALLILLLTLGFSDTHQIVGTISEQVGLPLVPAQLQIRGSVFHVADDADPIAQKFRQVMIIAATRMVQGQSTAFRDPVGVLGIEPVESDVLTMVCAYTVAIASKAATCPASTALNAAVRLQQLVTGTTPYIPLQIQPNPTWMEQTAHLIRRSNLVRWSIVTVINVAHGAYTEPWMRAIGHMATYLQDAGIAVYVLIRDLLLVSQMAELGLALFASDLLKYKEACRAHVELAGLGPYVKFLELPQAALFQAGRFPSLVEFMRGVASEISPQAVQPQNFLRDQ